MHLPQHRHVHLWGDERGIEAIELIVMIALVGVMTSVLMVWFGNHGAIVGAAFVANANATIRGDQGPLARSAAYGTDHGNQQVHPVELHSSSDHSWDNATPDRDRQQDAIDTAAPLLQRGAVDPAATSTKQPLGVAPVVMVPQILQAFAEHEPVVPAALLRWLPAWFWRVADAWAQLPPWAQHISAGLLGASVAQGVFGWLVVLRVISHLSFWQVAAISAAGLASGALAGALYPLAGAPTNGTTLFPLGLSVGALVSLSSVAFANGSLNLKPAQLRF